MIWSRPLGTGHSAILVDDGRLYTMYRAGNGRAKQGPWEAEETVIAMDAATGKTLWEHKYPSRREDFSFGAGPHSTPLIVGDRLFTIGTNKQMFAFDKKTGKVLWSHDFIKEFNSHELLIRPVVKTGYGCSPIAYRDTIICSVGGPGQSVMAFRQSDGAVVWKSGDFLTSEAPPIMIDVAGREQLVVFGGGTVNGMDPANGKILWSHVHDPGNDLNCGTPLFGPDNILFVSSAYRAGSRAIQLKPDGDVTYAEELWFTNRVRFMFLNAIRVGDFVYGTTGDFGPAFLTALNIKTGQAAWQHRGFGRASMRLCRQQGDHHGRRRRPRAGEARARRRHDPRRKRRRCSTPCRGPCRRWSARRCTRAIARRSSRSTWEPSDANCDIRIDDMLLLASLRVRDRSTRRRRICPAPGSSMKRRARSSRRPASSA